MKRAMTRVSSALGMIVLTAAVALAQPTSKSQTSQTGTPTEKTQTLSGTVVQVDGKVEPAVLKEIARIPANTFARVVQLGP